MSASKKIVLLGYFGVGKTSLIRRFVENKFSKSYKVSIGVYISKKEVLVNDKNITLIIWDMEGTKDINTVRNSYLLGTHGVMYVYDVGRKASYENIDNDLILIQNRIPGAQLCLIGNKSDLISPEIQKEIRRKKALKNTIFTSSKTGENVEEAFRYMAKLCAKWD